MRTKKILGKIASGLMAALLVTFLLPTAALAVVSPAFDALEIFAQEPQVTTSNYTGAVTNDTTVFDAALPASTTILYVIGGRVEAKANGEWRIGSQPVFVYESANTSLIGNPAVGDTVRVVGKRTLAAGPIVAQYISLIVPAPQAAGPAVVNTAYLLNGTVSANTTALWTVAGVDFNILPLNTTSAVGPTSIEGGLGSDSAVTVEFAITIEPPDVFTDELVPGDIKHNAARLKGHLDKIGSAAAVDVSFEYGETTAYGSATPPVIVNAAGAFWAAISGLQPATTYHFRAKADGGVRNGGDSGADMTFTTAALSAPSVNTDNPDGVTASSATLNGNLTNLGTATTVNVSFDWGAASGVYPNSTQAQARTTTGQFYATITGLSSGATYYVRARADGGTSGTGYGSERSFTTLVPSLPTPPPTDGDGSGGTGSGSGTSGSGSGTGSSGSGTGSGGSGTSGSGTGGSGTSGTSGPSASSGKTVALTGMTADKELKVDNSGKAQDKVKLSSSGPGDKYALEIEAGTVMKGPSGAAIANLTFSEPASMPPAPPEDKILVAEDLGPNGATFDPPITLTMSFDQAELPAGVDKKDLVIAFWDGAKWVPLDTTVDETTNMLAAKVSHFTIFAILTGAPKPAAAEAPATVLPDPEEPKEPEREPAPAAPAPGTTPQTNWSLIITIIGAAAVIIGVAVYALRRRSTT